MGMISISIVIPVYNAQKYLNKCFECLMNQSFTDFEAIFIDDGSIDASGAILDGFAEKDLRIRVVHQKNGGASAARNTGLGIATGKYISFIDADDLFHKDYLKSLYEAAEETDADIVQCGYKRVTENECDNFAFTTMNAEMSGNEKCFSNTEFLNKIYTSEAVDSIVLWNKIYRREIFDGILFHEGIMFEDELFSAKVIYAASKIVRISQVLYFYLYNEESVMNRTYSYRMLDILTALQLRMDFYKEHGLKSLYEKDSYKYLYKILLNYYEIDKLSDEHKDVLKDLKNKYWKKYAESLSFQWSLKRKAMMFFFGLFPKKYMAFYRFRNRK